MEICEISHRADLEKFWGREKLLHTKFQGNRSIMKCVMPIKTNIGGTALLTEMNVSERDKNVLKI